MTALDELAAAYPVDPARTYVTGLSTGGQGVFTIASAFPSRFAAAAPIGSTYDAGTPVCSMLDVPVWAFHGEFDTLQPPTNSTTYLDRLRTSCPMAPSQDPTLTLVSCRDPLSDHCGWVEAYDGTHGGSAGGFTSIWSWLLAYTR
jgi:predicted peptidase